MGWLTDIGVSRLLGQQGTTGGTSRAVNRPQLRGAGLEPYTGKGSSLTVAVGHWCRQPPAGLTHLVITLPDSGWNRAIRRAHSLKAFHVEHVEIIQSSGCRSQ